MFRVLGLRDLLFRVLRFGVQGCLKILRRGFSFRVQGLQGCEFRLPGNRVFGGISDCRYIRVCKGMI